MKLILQYLALQIQKNNVKKLTFEWIKLKERNELEKSYNSRTELEQI